MGFNTTVVICNDFLHQIKDDPKFGEKLYEAITNLGAGERYGLRTEFMGGGVKAIETHHADRYAIVAVGGNTGKVIDYACTCPDTDEEKFKWLKWMARRLNYYLRRVPKQYQM